MVVMTQVSRRTFIKSAALSASAFARGAASDKEIRLIALGQSLIEHDLRRHPYPSFRSLCERLRRADVCFSNLEVAIQGRNATAPTRKEVYFHGASPEVLDCLKAMSINLLSLSNNHSFDLSADGILTTIEETRGRGFGHAGTGVNIAAAAAPGYIKSSEGTLALVAFASKVPEGSLATESRPGVNHLCLNESGTLDQKDARRILASIELAARKAALVLVYQHDHYWEPNWHETPRWKRTWARECIDAGANAYISHGVPLLHGIEVYKQRPIFYGLGNFVFHTRTPVGNYEPAVWESVLGDCLFSNAKLVSLRLEPLVLNESGDKGENFFETRGRPTLASGQQAQAILERLRRLSDQFGTTIAINSGFAAVTL